MVKSSKVHKVWFLSYVDEAGPQAGHLKLGDRVLAINDDQRYEVLGLFEWIFVDGGTTYRVCKVVEPHVHVVTCRQHPVILTGKLKTTSRMTCA